MEQIQRRDSKPQFTHHGYTMQLVQFAAESGRMDTDRQNQLRETLHRAAAERAAAFTKGRSSTVSRKQAENFYAAVFFQLDAALLALGNDERALNALCAVPFPKLLDAGAQRILTLYEEAKTDFREAYALTEPVQTSFFHDLLQGFEKLTTGYDARFHAKDTADYVDFCYPLLRGRMPDEDGLLAVHAYYRSLRREGEFLHRFSADAVQGLMQRYAARFRTSPDMIAENIAELVFRQWIAAVLTNAPEPESLVLPADAAAELTAQFRGRSQRDLETAMAQAVRGAALTAEPAEMQEYLQKAVPDIADTMYLRIAEGNLAGWITADGCESF